MIDILISAEGVLFSNPATAPNYHSLFYKRVIKAPSPAMWWSTNLVQMLLSCVADERIPKDHHGTLGPAVCDLQVVRYARWIWIELAVKRPF